MGRSEKSRVSAGLSGATVVPGRGRQGPGYPPSTEGILSKQGEQLSVLGSSSPDWFHHARMGDGILPGGPGMGDDWLYPFPARRD